MFETFGDRAQGEGLNSHDGLISVLTVTHDAGQRRHFGEPPAIVFTFKLDRQGHGRTVTFERAD
jgi:hypothetical protein